MNQWVKDVIGNLLGRPSGRARYMTCPRGHVTLSRLPDNSRCDTSESDCDAVMRPLTAPLWGIFPLSERIIQLQTQLFKIRTGSAQYIASYQAFVKMNTEQNELTDFFRAHFPEDLSAGDNRTIASVAIARLKKHIPTNRVPPHYADSQR